MSPIDGNYSVLIIESDFYARHAINSYLAWDRRTRVVQKVGTMTAALEYLSGISESERPNTILLDGKLLLEAELATQTIKQLLAFKPSDIMVLAQAIDQAIAEACRMAGAKGYLKRSDVGLQIAWMIGWAKKQRFVVSPKTARFFPDAQVLPNGREYPELTDRVREALMLCVVEGMSADLAADEMGLSPHTIRTYIKEGYSILEAADTNEYPAGLSAQEKAFMRFTMLALDEHQRNHR